MNPSNMHILRGGPDRIISNASKKWRFEDHPSCGPIVIGKNGNPLEIQPPENSPFWESVQFWIDQGKQVTDGKTGEVWCVWDRPTMKKMKHLGGNNYVLVP